MKKLDIQGLLSPEDHTQYLCDEYSTALTGISLIDDDGLRIVNRDTPHRVSAHFVKPNPPQPVKRFNQDEIRALEAQLKKEGKL